MRKRSAPKRSYGRYSRKPMYKHRKQFHSLQVKPDGIIKEKINVI